MCQASATPIKTSLGYLPTEVLLHILRYLDEPPPSEKPSDDSKQPIPLKTLSTVSSLFRALTFNKLFERLELQQHFNERRIRNDELKKFAAFLTFVRQHELQRRATSATLRVVVHQNSRSRKELITEGHGGHDLYIKKQTRSICDLVGPKPFNLLVNFEASSGLVTPQYVLRLYQDDIIPSNWTAQPSGLLLYQKPWNRICQTNFSDPDDSDCQNSMSYFYHQTPTLLNNAAFAAFKEPYSGSQHATRLGPPMEYLTQFEYTASNKRYEEADSIIVASFLMFLPYLQDLRIKLFTDDEINGINVRSLVVARMFFFSEMERRYKPFTRAITHASTSNTSKTFTSLDQILLASTPLETNGFNINLVSHQGWRRVAMGVYQN
ncbi:hypothetical protein MMC21_001313 [Puttea exsequens]|nr:hypothetical protein [Puttea exsequens]